MRSDRRRFLAGFGTCAAGLLACGCETTGPGRISAGYVPAADTDEGGLWSVMDKAESDIKLSKFLVRDPALTGYVSEVACRVAPGICQDVRVYVVRAPYFNASMAPNGMLQVWTGLLTRVTDEAQLAAIIGHEIGHFLERHSLERWRAAKSALATSNVIGLGLGIAGAGVLAQLPGIVAIASVLAYTREQEREADAIGFDLMTRAGYLPLAASQVWQSLIEEEDADPVRKQRDLFTSTHPEPEERRDTLREMAERMKDPPSATGEEDYLHHARRLRSDLLDDEVRLRQPERSLVVIGRLRRLEPHDGELAFFEAEVLRLRGDPADLAKAEGLLVEAVNEGAPPGAWRSLGLLRRRRGADELADDAFRRYLERAPDAPDAPLIRSYLQR